MYSNTHWKFCLFVFKFFWRVFVCFLVSFFVLFWWFFLGSHTFWHCLIYWLKYKILALKWYSHVEFENSLLTYTNTFKRVISDQWLRRPLCWEVMPKPLEDSPCKQDRPHHSLSLLCLLGKRFKLFNERITHTSTLLKKINWYFPVGGFTTQIWLPLSYCYWCCD